MSRRVRVLALRVLVLPLHVGVAGGGVQVEVVLLHVLAVVALRGDDAEEALLEDGVALVPEGERKGQQLVAVADPGQAVLAPAVGPAAGVVVGEAAPRVAVRAVVLADGSPRALGDVRPPAPPAGERAVLPGQPLVLDGRGGTVHALRQLR